jgi:hypothetical protein
MRWLGLLTALGTLIGSFSTAQAIEVSIVTPENGGIVKQSEVVAGYVSLNTTVWVVIHPLEDNRYWVQPSTDVSNSGK